MEHRDQSHQVQGALYAHIIVAWHAQMGANEWLHRYGHEIHEIDERFARYQRMVARFSDSDLSDPGVQAALANEQLAGSMEWAYMMPIAEPMLGLNLESRHLGAIARRLQELASRNQQHEPTTEGERTIVRFRDEEDLLAQAREVYGAVAGAEVQGAGGISFLLSCSLERSERPERGEIVLLSPRILGASPAPRGRKDDLLDQLGSGGLEILGVTGS